MTPDQHKFLAECARRAREQNKVPAEFAKALREVQKNLKG